MLWFAPLMELCRQFGIEKVWRVLMSLNFGRKLTEIQRRPPRLRFKVL
jgi:hypothetical protein